MKFSVRRTLRITTVVAVLTLFTAAAVALWGPGILRDRAKAWVAEETGRSLEIGKISVNLLAMSVEIRDLSLSEPGQSLPFVQWQRLYVALSPRSLWHRAPVVREVLLENPRVRIERRPDGHFNFSDLLERKPAAAEPAADQQPARFSLNNLVIHGGRIEILDRTLETPARHLIDDVELAVPFVGNLPYLADRYVKPLLQARINGTPLDIKGELKPFADTQEYVVKLKFDGIDLPRYLAYLPEPLPVTVNSARLDLDLDLSYRASASTEPVLEVAGRIDLTTLDLRERDGRPLFFLPLLETRLAPSRLLDRDIHLASLHLSNPQSWINRDTSGIWNINRLLGTAPPPVASPQDHDEAALPLKLVIDRIRLHDGRLAVRDDLPAGGFTTTLTGINLDVDSFTLAENSPFKLALDFGSERQERLGISGQVTIHPLTLDLEIATKGIPLAAYQPYYQEQTTAMVEGVAQASTRLQVSPEIPLLLSNTHLEISGLNLPLPHDEGFKLAGLAIQGGSYDRTGNHLEIGEVTLTRASLSVSRSKDGRWSFQDRSYPIIEKLSEPATAEPPGENPGQPFSYRIGQVTLNNGNLFFHDNTPGDPAELAISGLTLALSDLAAPEKVPGKFDLAGTFQKKGNFHISGTLVPTGPEVVATVQLQRIGLASFAPYIADKTRLILVDGALDSLLEAKIYRQDERWLGHVSGEFGIGRFYCLDAAHREDLLRWERLQFNNFNLRLEPLALKIGSIALNNYYARVLLDEQANLNLAQLFAETADSAAPSPEPAEAKAAAEPAASPEISIGKITLQGGKVNFTDRHLPKAFSAEMLQLGGRVEGLSSTPGARAEVDLRGRLRNESPLRITGTLNPLADPLFLNLKLDFNDIELSPLSPYSGTYVGYLIERGKLNVTLEYLVENGKLTASNKLFLDQFDFGAKVESDKATSLPVRLAVALLKDRKGEIHLDIPVSGNLDDPQFSVWGIVWQIVRNLLVKAVTSPLALLGALGGGGEDFSAIVFPYGSTKLADAEQAKLVKIASALRDRPELKLEVKAYVDPEQDPEAYRQELLKSRIRRAKLIDLRKRQGDAVPADVEAVSVTPEEYPEYLWRVYKETDFPKPRNFIGMVKHLPDAELEKLLLANTRVGNEELATLAQARASTVVAALVETGGIPRERVFLATTEITTPAANTGISRSRVEFGMAVK